MLCLTTRLGHQFAEQFLFKSPVLTPLQNHPEAAAPLLYQWICLCPVVPHFTGISLQDNVGRDIFHPNVWW